MTSFPGLTRQDWPHDNAGALDAFYGNPLPLGNNPAWEAANLVYVSCPWTFKGGGNRIRFHKKAAASLTRILIAVWEHCGRSQATIGHYHLDEFGGSYVPRMNRNDNSKPSNHSFGIAIDWAPDENPNRSAWVEDASHLPRFFIEAFKQEGWRWGGDYKTTKDAMHFEAVFNDETVTQVPVPTAVAPQIQSTDAIPVPVGTDPAMAALREWLLSKAGISTQIENFHGDALNDISAVQQAITTAQTGLANAQGMLTALVGKFQSSNLTSPTPPPPPAVILHGDGSYSFTAEVVGDDIVVKNVVCTWFGGPNDPSDNGMTASGISTRANPTIQLCSLPTPGSPLTSGTPLPKLPWHLPVKVKNLDTGQEATFPLEERGPSKKAASRAAIDLTEYAFRAIGGDTNVGRIRVDYTILGGAKYAQAQGGTTMSMPSTQPSEAAQVSAPLGTVATSKVNVTQPIAVLAQVAAVWVGQKYGLDAMTQGALAVVIQTVASSATVIFRTWYTTKILPQSLPQQTRNQIGV